MCAQTNKKPIFLFLRKKNDLYQNEPIFKQAVDDCATLLEDDLKEDIRKIIYPENPGTEAEEKINNTYYTQPAMFVM